MFQTLTPRLRSNVLSEADPDFDKKAASLPAAQQAALAAAKRNVHRTLEAVQNSTGIISDVITAKFKIEILFGPKRSIKGPNAVRIMLWESGSKLNGGGDASLFFCKDGTKEDGEGCWAPIQQHQVDGPFATCTSCNRICHADKLTIMKEGYVTTEALAQEITRLFRALGSSCDIYCKYNKDDIHYISMERQFNPDKAKRLLGLHIYSLKNIVKDTANGADLTKRFVAFLSS